MNMQVNRLELIQALKELPAGDAVLKFTKENLFVRSYSEYQKGAFFDKWEFFLQFSIQGYASKVVEFAVAPEKLIELLASEKKESIKFCFLPGMLCIAESDRGIEICKLEKEMIEVAQGNEMVAQFDSEKFKKAVKFAAIASSDDGRFNMNKIRFRAVSGVMECIGISGIKIHRRLWECPSPNFSVLMPKNAAPSIKRLGGKTQLKIDKATEANGARFTLSSGNFALTIQMTKNLEYRDWLSAKPPKTAYAKLPKKELVAVLKEIEDSYKVPPIGVAWKAPDEAARLRRLGNSTHCEFIIHFQANNLNFFNKITGVKKAPVYNIPCESAGDLKMTMEAREILSSLRYLQGDEVELVVDGKEGGALWMSTAEGDDALIATLVYRPPSWIKIFPAKSAELEEKSAELEDIIEPPETEP